MGEVLGGGGEAAVGGLVLPTSLEEGPWSPGGPYVG